MQTITISFEVDDDIDPELLLEAITKMVHGETLNEDEEDHILNVVDVQLVA